MDKVICYAQRLLNPFRGLLQTIAYASAEAVTTDGVHWDIYVRNDDLVKDLEDSNNVQTSDIRYGSWSVAKGLKRGPIFPSEDFKRMEEMGAVVYEHLLDDRQKIPFPLQDQYELWLLDTDGFPLALLDSAVFAHSMDTSQNIEWRAGLLCRENFSAQIMQDIQEVNGAARGAGEYLAQYINSMAGEHPAAQWFQRREDGSGFGLQGVNVDASMVGARLPQDAFPRNLLRSEGHDDQHSILIDEFFRWQAPWLLLLPSLKGAQRREFERHARAQALVIDKQFRLYPEIIDIELIKSARVEAMLRNGLQPERHEDDVMSTFYIELHPNPTE